MVVGGIPIGTTVRSAHVNLQTSVGLSCEGTIFTVESDDWETLVGASVTGAGLMVMLRSSENLGCLMRFSHVIAHFPRRSGH